MMLPPLVAPRAELTPDEISRYSRHLLLPDVGLDGQRRLKTARVLVIGAGGLGSPVLLYLAAAGVGCIGIVEFDSLEVSNLQRQVIHGMSDLGQPKAQSAARALRELNPLVNIQLHVQRLEAHNALEILDGYDLVIDGTDNFATRYLVNDACVLAGKPCVWGSIYRFEGQASVFWEDAPGGSGLNYRDLYPEPPPPELAPSCAEGGVLGVLCASIGSVMATEAIKLITGLGESLLGRLMVYDALDMAWRCMPIRRDPQRTRITRLIDYPAFCGFGTAPSGEVPAITAAELKVLLEGHSPPVLIDVREASERHIVNIPGSVHVPKGSIAVDAWLAALSPQTPIVLHCKSGVRSRQALLALRERGYARVRHLEGGILAWVDQVDPSLPRY
ncbi:molybdopterin-synthase adenylyltransferase MoeB [Acidovorax sp. NCPPB 3576]|uniref:molybdopterin-synthase adenylyltransferase MoeB n=1 Tax=Acidovorax sp. NCPPB 3576 TaxID=2940488 RepID=UPI0023490DE8|nr:molybdopterin-synthase adenylyltransferase MoeB [Acidovorax sp. NCPPB 3576]WCM86557.1 molybdopterin-synthase adenylyltransferase MoeB [Acidovorax sp. NCPPB 3576]